MMFNPIWGIDGKHYFLVTTFDDCYDHLAIDDDGFALGTDESFNDFDPPVFLGMLNSLMLSGARQLIGLSYPILIRTSSFCIFSYTSWRCTGISTGAFMPSRTVSPLTPSTVTTTLSWITMLSFSFLLKTNMGRSFSSQASNGVMPQKTREADVAEHSKVSIHVGLLVNEPPG